MIHDHILVSSKTLEGIVDLSTAIKKMIPDQVTYICIIIRDNSIKSYCIHLF